MRWLELKQPSWTMNHEVDMLSLVAELGRRGDDSSTKFSLRCIPPNISHERQRNCYFKNYYCHEFICYIQAKTNLN